MLSDRFAGKPGLVSARSMRRWIIPVEHGIKRRNFVHPHGWHRKKFGNIVHDANARPSLVLPLCNVEQRNSGRFLVLRRIVGNDLIGPCEVFGSELKRDLGVENCVSETSEQI